ncbi:MAG: antitoxin VapB family protein [Candidatus Micrarchaeota archaeon]
MVKVITIMDDVYSELYKLKKAKGLSFTGAIRHLLNERTTNEQSIISFAGSISEEDIDRRSVAKIRRVL